VVHSLLGCQVSEDQFASWEKLLVPEVAPYFYVADIDLPADSLILSRKTFSAAGFDLAFRDTYTTYAVSHDAGWVVLLTSAQFDALPLLTQQALLAAQCQHKRGQVYPWEQVEKFLSPFSVEIEPRCVTISGSRYVVLDTKIWALLTPDVRRQWLIDYIQSDTPTVCLSSEYASRCTNPIVRQLAGTFAATSGANCFSTTLACVTHDQATARTIANFWLHQEPFFQGLARRGYQLRTDLSVSTPDLSDAVLIWQDANGQAQHACYLAEHGFVLNKNSQAWYSPRQLLRLPTVLDDWQSYGYEITVYSRDS